MSNNGKIAIFWDKSFLWGLIAYDTFRRLGVGFQLLTAADICQGALEGFPVLFVPGGWASDKAAVLGNQGRDAVRDFVGGGGSYLGFCGGAGLALSHDSGLGLAPFGRMPTGDRLPSFSGKIALKHAETDHPMWSGIDDGSAFHAWWPGQFAIDDDTDARVLATYGAPLAGSYVTDLPIGPAYDWKKWEDAYGINLNPNRIVNEPAVVETAFGDGKVMLSYLHFETPDARNGHQVLLNLLDYLSDNRVAAADDLPAAAASILRFEVSTLARQTEAAVIAGELSLAANAFIVLGKRNFLWFERNEWLLQWRRGVRGIEYSTLAAMLKQIARLVAASGEEDAGLLDELAALQAQAVPFLDDARKLIMLERFAMNSGPLSPLKTDNKDILALRDRLFSTSKRCGGDYEQIINRADEILLPLLRRETGASLAV